MRNNNQKTGVLLVNLGTPDDPSPAGVRAFLREMLSDRRIVELPRALWWPILHGVVLRTRPKRSAEAYRKIWTPEGSPQLVIGQRLAQTLRTVLNANYAVELGMTYRNPSIADAVSRLLKSDVHRLLVVPLFPQYSGATSG